MKSLIALAGLAVATAQQTAPLIHLHREGPASIAIFVSNADGTGERRLDTTSDLAYSPTFSPDGKWIAFASERSGSTDLYRIRNNGTGLERLTRQAAFEDQPAYSPDGTQIAYVSNRGADITDIWIYDIASKNSRNLTSAPGGDFRPSWSPDGKWIAFSSDRGTKPRYTPTGLEPLHETSIYIVKPDASEARRITEAGLFAGSPKWSPDSKRVVFYEMTAEATAPARRTLADQKGVISQIVSIDIDSGERLEHSKGPGLKVSPQYINAKKVVWLDKAARAMRNPVWSPDGKFVVYEKVTPRARRQGESLLSAEPGYRLTYTSGETSAANDGNRIVVTEGGSLVAYDPVRRVILPAGKNKVLGASWSPDGAWIAVGYGASFDADWGTSQIAIVKPDGTGLQIMTKEPAGAAYPSWSPDGKKIVYRVQGRMHRGLRVLDIEKGEATILTDGRDDHPVWSPDGGLIAYTGFFEDDFDVFTIKPDGAEKKRITPTIGIDRLPAWTADGKGILFTSDRHGFHDEAPLYDGLTAPNAELFIMDFDGKKQTRLTANKWQEGTSAWQPGARQ
ncbi:MAG: hypothetical protein FJW38_03940 [Acidobacteria bacterium]|nr:hypothetical protein [Acidobacteriota bacterium]